MQVLLKLNLYGQTVRAYAARLEEELANVSAWLRSDRYVPQPVRRVWIPKPGRFGSG